MIEEPRKRQISNAPRTEERKYKGSKASRQRAVAIKKIKYAAKIATITAALAATVVGVGVPVIENMLDNHNRTTTVKEAIIAAETTNDYQKEIKEQDVKQEISEFNDLVNRYKELTEKKDKTGAEQVEQIQTAMRICNLYPTVIDFRTALLRTEVADAVGITDPEEIAKIKITCAWHYEGSSVPSASVPSIELPNGTEYLKGNMDSKLVKEIEDVRQHLDYGIDTENATEQELYKKAEDIIKYYNDIDYSQKYDIEGVEKEGKKPALKTVKESDDRTDR